MYIPYSRLAHFCGGGIVCVYLHDFSSFLLNDYIITVIAYYVNRLLENIILDFSIKPMV